MLGVRLCWSLPLSRFLSRRINLFRTGALAGLLVLFGTAANIAAQTVEFDGTQRPVAFGFYEPEGVAVDQYGNLFVADADTYEISEILAVNGSIPPNPTIRVLHRDTSNPFGITVDRNGNVFFSDANQTIQEILAVNGSIPTSPTVLQLGSGTYFEAGLGSDVNGNVYVANGTSILEVQAVSGSVPPSPVIVTLASGFSGARGVTADSQGNVYVADLGNHAVKEIQAVNGIVPPSPIVLTLAGNYCSPDGVSLDGQGNLYFSDYCNAAIYEILAVNGTMPASPVVQTIDSGNGLGGVTDVAVDGDENIYAGGVYSGTQIPQVYPSDFGPVSVGTTVGSKPLMFTIVGSVTLGSVTISGADFANAGTGTCVAGNTYNSPSSYSLCTVTVTFTPKLAGARSGAVILKNASGNTIATGYVHGTGVAPLVNFEPPIQSAVVSGVSSAGGVATDGSGNLYIAATGQNQILKETLSGGSYTQSVIPTSTLNAPRGVAVDSAGNIYIADSGNNRVLQETPSPTGFTETATSEGGLAPAGVAVDEDGHLDVVFTDGIFTGFHIDGYLGTGLSGASGVAVDASDNLYIVSNSTPGSILKEALVGGNYVSSSIPLSGFSTPSGISIDGFGNLYVSGTDSNGVGQVVELTPSQGGYTQSTISTQGLSQPAGVAVDSFGNIFIVDSTNGRVVKVDSSDTPSLTFASTAVGSTSANSPQTVTVENNGNAMLTFPIPGSGSNPGISANFTLNENAQSACAVTNSGSAAPGTLAAGTSCVLPISFSPAVAGSLSGALVLTDNNQNATAPAYVAQTISLSGTATPATPVITWSAPAAIAYGTALGSAQLDATANVAGTFSYSPSAGTVLHPGTQTLSVTFTPSDGTDYTTASASVQLTVNKATPVLSWTTPAPITYGTALSATQLDAKANVAGTFVYSPAAKTVLPVGVNTLNVTFTPTDKTDYTTTTDSVQLTVNPTPGFTLAALPSSVSMKQGSSANSTITVNAVGGFSSSVTLSASGLPKGVSASFSPNPTTGSSSLTLSATGNATTGTSSVTVTGKSGKLVETTTITLSVSKK